MNKTDQTTAVVMAICLMFIIAFIAFSIMLNSALWGFGLIGLALLLMFIMFGLSKIIDKWDRS